MRRSLAVLAALALPCLALTCLAQDDHLDTLTGPVTAITSPTTFDVSGQHVSLTPDAEFAVLTKSDAADAQANPPAPHVAVKDLFVGERVQVSGSSHGGKHSFVAENVIIVPPPMNISGAAIIDLVPTPQPALPGERLIRADGYLLRITPNSKLAFAAPLNSAADVSTNQWIEYSGTVQPDGAILITSAAISPNVVSKTEEKIREKTDYDPSKVPYVAEETDMSVEYFWSFYQHVGPWPDAAMQARIQRIGNSLIPAYQRALPASDPTWINFRFEAIDEQHFHDPIALPSGIILVPYQVIERTHNDDEIATILADGMAQILEKDALRLHPLGVAGTVGTIAEWATIPVPVANLAASVATTGVKAGTRYEADTLLEQSGRLSLCLLHDAGYDISQAPVAWWHLADKKGKPLDQIRLPGRANNLYTSLGLVWRNPAMNAARPTLATGPATDVSTASTTSAATQN